MGETGEFTTEFLNAWPKIVNGLIGKGEEWDRSLSRAIVQLHQGTNRQNAYQEALPDIGQPPKIIFVTVTTAVPYAYAMKECWKQVYPSEKEPEFIFIDVSHRRWGTDTKKYRPLASDKTIEKYYHNQTANLHKKAEQLGALDNVAIFDEFPQAHQRGTRGTLVRAMELLEEAKFTNISVCSGRWGFVYASEPINELRPIYRNEDWDLPVRNLIIQKEGKPLVADMKKIGGLMAQEIRNHDYKE